MIIFHPDSHSLTTGDLLFYQRFKPTLMWKHVAKLKEGDFVFHPSGWSRIKNGPSLRDALIRTLDWDYDRYISLHGSLSNIAASGIKEKMSDVIQWLDKGIEKRQSRA